MFLDTPNRVQPHTQQFSAGFQRQLGPALSASADYVHTIARDQWLLENLNPGLRVNTTASGAIIRVDPNLRHQRVAAAEHRRIHLRRAQRGPGKARLAQLERPCLVHAGQFTRELQRGRDLDEQLPGLNNANLDLGQGPTDFDRRHNLVLSGRIGEVPRTHGMTLSGTLRVLSGLPFSLVDTSTDPDRNGILVDPLPAGTYSGTGPNAITVDNNGGRNGA